MLLPKILLLGSNTRSRSFHVNWGLVSLTVDPPDLSRQGQGTQQVSGWSQTQVHCGGPRECGVSPTGLSLSQQPSQSPQPFPSHLV